ncbi:SCO6745 family protein [Actinoplanes sp. NPDC026623]|uniref:SCO6745 family protein n=1 Tax=Actinoplanes sp. NPDC026623 TaxID=3155610 RepID=UPI0033D10B1B
MTEVTPALAREAWRLAEPLHAMIYFVPESRERFDALGIGATAGYFASRGGALGPSGPGPVVATFYNFNPELVAGALPAAWRTTTPAAALAARLDAADAALTRGLGDAVESPEVAEAAELARLATESATAYAAGRPLFAAHAALDWPDRPHLVLWHAVTVLREFRGDGHVAALLVAGLTGLQSMVLHTASGQVNGEFLRASRGWSREQWAEQAAVLRERGLLDGEELSDRGRELRARIEDDTDRLALPAYEVLGAERCGRLAELVRPLSRTLVKAGFLAAAAPQRK